MDSPRERDSGGPTALPGTPERNQRPFRVAGVDPERGFSGGETQVLGLARALTAEGHCVELLCDPMGMLWVRAELEGIACHSLPIRNSVDISAGIRLRELLRRGHYDIVHFHTARAHALAPYARGTAGALIVTRRMDYVPNRLFAPWLFNRAVDGVAAISKGVAQALMQAGVRRERIVLIPSGVDCERFAPPDEKLRLQARERIGAGADDIVLGMVGALTPRKGHSLLLRALALMAKSRSRSTNKQEPRLLCFIAGAGPSHEAITAEISKFGLGNSVRMLGSLEDPRALLWALDVFVMPSQMEGLGVAVIEAMAAGLPVVACAVGGLRDAVEHGRTGWLVSPDDEHVMADALTRLSAAPELRASMGAAGREMALTKFSMEKMAQRTLALYRASFDRKRTASNRE
jgi:L-malate glycosyltransferase